MTVDLNKAAEALGVAPKADEPVLHTDTVVTQEEVRGKVPPFEVKEIYTSVRVAPAGTFSSVERGLLLGVNTADVALIEAGKKRAAQQALEEALQLATEMVQQGQSRGILK